MLRSNVLLRAAVAKRLRSFGSSSSFRTYRGQGRVAVASFLAVSAVILDQTRTAEEQSFHETYSLWKPSAALCDAAAFLSLPRMRRHATVEKLQETATDEYRLEDKYKIAWNKPLGEGAYGAVFSAIHRQTGEKVAVKKISKRLTNNSSFQREMDSLMLLRENGGHPNVCSMRENFDEGDHFYIVMDLVSGRELFEQLCCAGPYSEADAAQHIREAADALSYLHGIGIVHCDIKAENLMLSSNNDSDAVVKIVDFGCAHLERNAPFLDHQPKSTANTPAYCPPEVLRQMRGNKQRHPTIDAAFDMWSFGVLCYIVLVGAHPFDLDGCSTDEEIEQKVLSGEKPPLRGFEYADHLSDDAIALIEGLIEWDPKKRLTAEQVLQNRWVQGETASSKKMADSDKRLAAFRKYSTRIGATFFKTLLSQTDAIRRKKNTERTSLLESAFRQLDTGNRGYISTNEMKCDDQESEEDTQLSFSDVSCLLSENIKNRYFPKGHVVYHEGEPGDSMFFIDSGTIEVTTKEGLVMLRQAGDIFGDDVMMMSNADKSYISTVRCLTPVHVLEITRGLFNKYVSSDKETFLSMAETDRHRRRERANSILQLQKEYTRQQSYGKGETIFSEGEKRDDLFLLDEGEVVASVSGHKMRSLKRGEMMGEHAAYFHKPYNVTAQCISSQGCKVQVLPSEAMHRLFDGDPSLRQDFRDLMLRRDFKKALIAEIKKPFPSTEEEIRAAFESIDTNGSGEIAFDRLRAVVQRFDPSYSDEDIHDMLDSLDLNKSGSLTWQEFNRIYAMDKEA